MHSSSVKKNPSKRRYLEKHFYMLPWCIFLEHWIRVFSHHIINCLYDIHHFLPWQHASTSTKRKLREMRAHFCLVLPYSSPFFSMTNQHLECLCLIMEADVPDTQTSCRKNFFSLPLPCHVLPVFSPLPWAGSDTAGAGSKGCAQPCTVAPTLSQGPPPGLGIHSWNWESGPSPCTNWPSVPQPVAVTADPPGMRNGLEQTKMYLTHIQDHNAQNQGFP